MAVAAALSSVLCGASVASADGLSNPSGTLAVDCPGAHAFIQIYQDHRHWPRCHARGFLGRGHTLFHAFSPDTPIGFSAYTSYFGSRFVGAFRLLGVETVATG